MTANICQIICNRVFVVLLFPRADGGMVDAKKRRCKSSLASKGLMTGVALSIYGLHGYNQLNNGKTIINIS
jgi:hypothetical protein